MPSSDAASHSDNDDGARALSSSSDPSEDASDSASHQHIRNEGDGDDDDEEEVEIEEEIEVEEEIEIEVEEEEDDNENDDKEEKEEEEGDNSSDSPIAADDNQNDVSQDKESEGHKGQLSAPTKESSMKNGDSKCSVVGKLMGIPEENGFQESAVDEGDAGALSEKRTSKNLGEVHCDRNTDLPKSEIVNADATKSSSVTGREVVHVMPMKDGLVEEANGVLYYEEELKQIDMQSGEDIKQRASRLAAPRLRPRSLSPGAEFEDGNKRPAVACDFFAKGWCIKGSSCRFLHKKDHAYNPSLQPEGDVAVANLKSELEVDEGSRDIIERSRLPEFPDPRPSSVGNNTSFSSYFSSEKIPLTEDGESQSWYQLHEKHSISLPQREDLISGVSCDSERSPLSKDDPRFIPSFKGERRDSLRQSWSTDDYGNHASPIIKGSSPILRNSLFPGGGSLSSSSVISSSTYRSSGLLSSYATRSEELASNKSQFMLNDHISPILSHSLNSTSNTFRPISSMLPSRHISPWAGASSSFSSSSLNAEPLDSQKHLDSDGEYHASRSASLPRSCSPFSGSEPENLRLTNYSGNPSRTSGYKTKISSHDWEPSVPFRPSFFIGPSSVSSPGSQYDPLRDSIEQCMVGDRSSNVFSYGLGASIPSTSHQRINGVPVMTGIPDSAFIADKHSISFDHKFHDNVLDKNWSTYGKDLFANAAKTAGTSVANLQNKTTLPNEEKRLGPDHLNDIKKADKVNIDQDSRHSSGGARHRELKLRRDRQNKDADVDSKTDGSVHKESKALRHFRAALVDFVKELVKPAWREGHLSKDAHKMIVKKAVDKVLSTSQSHQIPNTLDAIKQYLSSSRPKIAKLVEGYTDKYGKS